MHQNLFDHIVRARPLRGQARTRKPHDATLENLSPQSSALPRLASPAQHSAPSASLPPFAKYVIPFSLLVLLSVLLFLGRAFTLQVLRGDEYSQLSLRNRTRAHQIPAPRGVIYDRNDQVVVRNRPTFNLVLNVSLCSLGKDTSLCKNIVNEVGLFLNIPESSVQEILARLEESTNFGAESSLVIATDLEKEQVLTIESRGIPAVDVVTFPSREYVYPEAFAHLIGYTGLSAEMLAPVIEGKAGIEAFYDSDLAGFPGKRVVQVNARNESVTSFDVEDPVAGENVVLFADSGLQKLAYEVLREVVDGVPASDRVTDFDGPTAENMEGFSKKARAGVVVAQDPRTGGILALVNYPSFDAQRMVSKPTSADLREMESQGPFPFFNRAISAGYAPGSTFKLVMGAAILEEGIASVTRTIFDPGYISVAGYRFNNWKLDGHGYVDLLRALQVSNDPYFYIMGGGYEDISGLGISRINKWARKFGFGAKTGIDLFGEISGFVPDSDYKDWYLGDTYITSIGQGDFLATPLQVNVMTTYFANGRELLQPRVVASVGGVPTDRVVLAEGLVSPKALDAVREGVLRAASPGGTGYPLFDFADRHGGVVVAGKTGTSEYIDSDGEYGTHAMFTAWAPYEDPEIVLTVLLEGGGSGAHDAAPVARRLLDSWFSGPGL